MSPADQMTSTASVPRARDAVATPAPIAHVTFLVLTYLRPVGLERALRALAAMDLPATRAFDGLMSSATEIADASQTDAGSTALGIDVIVVDNDPAGSAEAVVARVVETTGLACRYVVEARRGITYGRNRALDEARRAGAEWIAWLDDDEAPRSDWLQRVVATQQNSGADVVMGPSNPVFEPDVEDWIVDSGAFHPDRFTTGDAFPFFHARTSGILVRLDGVPADGFDDRLALTGGEDRVLFTRMHRSGASFAWCDEAIVDEWVPTSRVSVGWLTRRWFRIGVTRSLTLLYLDQPSWPRRVRRVAGGLAMAAQGVLGVLTALPRGKSRLLASVRLVLIGCGASYGALGLHFREYRKVHGA